MKSPVSVLVLEKSQVFSSYLALLLQSMGLKSLRCNELEATKTALARGFSDVLIIGDQNGAKPVHVIVQELANCISDNSIPIIVVSTCADPVEQKACYEAGCQDYLTKPIRPKQLHDALYARVTPVSKRRKNLRSNVNLTAEVTIDNLEPQKHGVLTLSKGGGLISSPRIMPTGTKVNLTLFLEENQIPLSGTVLYTLLNVKGSNTAAFGVLFHHVSQIHADMIEQYLEKILAQGSLVGMASEQIDSTPLS
jgi:DNA-binding response OmpR family regulator